MRDRSLSGASVGGPPRLHCAVVRKSGRFRCVRCGASYSCQAVVARCPCSLSCSFATVDFVPDFDGPSRAVPSTAGAPGFWSLDYCLPLTLASDERSFLPPIGGTPLYQSRRLSTELGIPRLWIKDERYNLTGSHKDRSTLLGVLDAIDRGVTTVACASTGNAAVSMAGCASFFGLRGVAFVGPQTTPGKLALLEGFGGEIHVVGGENDPYAASDLACERNGWYNCSCAFNPLLMEGKKTCAHEIAVGMSSAPPQWVIVPVGDGCTYAAIAKGFLEARRAGVIASIPRLLGVQAAGVAPIFSQWQGTTARPVNGLSIADGIAVPTPRNLLKALSYCHMVNGAFISVDEGEIISASSTLRSAGLLVEYTAAAAYAGLRRAFSAGLLLTSDSIVMILTSTGYRNGGGGTGSLRPSPGC